MAKVSVCIPTYNYGQFIGEAIESVLGQTMQDFELIISDNASQDDTEARVSAYAAKDARIRYSRNSSNLGMVANWNRCLELAGGEYIKYLCADDLLEPDCLEQLSRLLDTHPTAALASCARRIISGDDSSTYLSFSDAEELVAGPECIRRMLVSGNIIGEPTAVMFRRNSASRGFDPGYQQLTDMDFWLHLLEQGAFAFSPESLCVYRQHDAMETKKNMRSLRIFTEGRRIFRTYSLKPGVRLGRLAWIFCSVRPLLAFLYCWLYARFSGSNKHIGERQRQPGVSRDKGA
jgi:glycosyltransferase involved in cell wall biosynthesis